MLTAKLIDSVAAEDLTGAAECLEKGANPNALSGDGATAMHIAAGIGVDAVRLMLTYCGDPNIRSVDGSTPLHVAAAWGDRDTLRLLLHNGADPNLMDHEGQRAVDVAKSERHAACVDFLKYYTMLVTVGDEEEGQMYTSELLDPSQGGVACGSDRDSPSPHGCHIQSPHYLPHFSSDDEDPANLSDQYSDALSRRLSRLLNDGKGACLDVTSPDCPYIGTKQDRNRGGGDRTLVADDTCTLLPHLVDSDTSEMDLAVSEGQSSCRCRSNHCCSHNPAKQSDLGARQKTPVFCDQHHLDCPGLPECRDSQAVYARDLEKKMKQRSPVTILHVQCEHSCPSPSMFRRGAHFPFTLSSPKREKTEFTTISGICKKDIPVAGSCSAVSVDSGFCEKCTTEQKLGADILRCEPKFLGSKQQEHTSPLLHGKKTAGATMRQMPDKENGEKGSERPFDFDGYKFSRGEDTKNLPFEDGCKIVSSNLGGRKCVLDLSTLPHHEPADCEGQGWPRRNFTEKGEGQGRPTWNFTEEGEGQVRAGRKLTDEGEMMTRREASRQEVLADVSESSCDSFQTCEEASLQDTAVDAKSEHRSHRRKSQQHSDNLPPDNRKQSTRTVEAGVKEQEKASFCTPDRDTELHFQMQSLGFTVSEAGGNQHNHSSSTKRKGHTQASYLIRDSHGKEKVDPKETDTAGQRSIGKDKSDPGQTDTAGQRGVTMLKGHHQSLVSHHKSWLPPSGLLLDDSDLLTSDGSFMATAPGQQTNNQLHSLHSSNVSRWLQSVPTATLPSKPQDAKQRRNRASKRVSDESLMSVASSVQEYIYRDKENGIALIERHIPSDFSGSSGRPSLETEGGLDTDATVSYDWTDFSINSGDVSSSSSSSFDITAGQTMRSQETLKGSDSNGCGEECSSTSDDCQEDSGDGRRQGDKENDDGNRQEDKENDDGNRQVDQENEKNTKEKQNKGDKPQKIAESGGKKTNTKSLDADSQQTEDSNQADSPVSSDHAAISPELASLSNLAIYQSLKAFGEDPGPVIQSTRQTYLQLLADLHNGKRRLGLTSSQPGYSSELNRLLSGSVDVEDLAKAELSMVAPFQTPDGRAWREGTIKSCFNYLLLDPRVTKNLPLRAKSLSDLDAFKIFLSAVFYIGKGKRSRPYCHLYEAISQQKSPKQKVSQKVQVILEVWAAGLGVVSLHCFQNVIPVEAYTREACMVDAIGLGRLTNVKRGDYYGVASTWPTARRQSMGAYLLRKAFQIFLSEGERQICPLDIQKGK
ncbi:uncharacterized protein LOC143282294 [Babylonia areolata]|uniref:uncharacterized protein LOC143282294 n=1 Tax=Babylonia areolata TaxID=304850 RepID=UPI003FD409E5